MVCAASKALAERAERARSKFSAKASKMPKHLHFCSKLKISKSTRPSKGPDPKTPFWRSKSSETSKLLKIFALSES